MPVDEKEVQQDREYESARAMPDRVDQDGFVDAEPIRHSETYDISLRLWLTPDGPAWCAKTVFPKQLHDSNAPAINSSLQRHMAFTVQRTAELFEQA